ncbi:hypothetical protein, partial [uncultured Aquimarina sp.]|uniref:hypothetical protein n=1 Tax=uncultured Aquimarina sp. TaxID=575652 RepID=UPI00263315A5
NICVVAGQNVTLFSTKTAHWLLTFTFCKHCATVKIHRLFESSLNCYEHIYSVMARTTFTSLNLVNKPQ